MEREDEAAPAAWTGAGLIAAGLFGASCWIGFYAFLGILLARLWP